MTFFRYQKGSLLIETLVSLLLFSIGIVSIVSMQAASVSYAGDAKYRSDAAFFAEQIVGMMWADQRSNLMSYAHNASGSVCAFSGTASSNIAVANWIGSSDTPGTIASALPGTINAYHQIKIDTGNKVKVVICWKTPKDASPRHYELVTQINGGI